MSLNKTLDRLFDEIRREAKRNPDFANRLDAILRLHESRRDVPDEVTRAAAAEAGLARAEAPPVEDAPKRRRRGEPAVGAAPAPTLNPAGLFKREGEDALTAALAALDEAGLRALIAEHNLDPAGETDAMAHEELATHIIAQAKRRAERDKKMFDY